MCLTTKVAFTPFSESSALYKVACGLGVTIPLPRCRLCSPSFLGLHLAQAPLKT